MSGTTIKAEDLPALTGLRFVAAGMIVVHHMRGAFGLPQELLPGFPLDNGVSFFFVLSGFILTHVYRSVRDVADRNDFYLARFARIWPTHIACLIVWLILIGDPARVGTSENWIAYILNIFLLQAWVPDYRVFFSLNAVSWTISVEAFFYMLFPFIAMATWSRLALWLIFSFFLVISMALFDVAYGAKILAYINAPRTIDGLMYVNPLSRLFEFVLGILSARLWMRHAHWLNGGELRATLLQCLAVVLLIATIANFGLIFSLAHNAFGLPFGIWVAHAGANCVPFALLITAFAARGGLLRNFFSSASVVFLGKISFALYLFHQIPITFYHLNGGLFAGVNNGILIFAYLVIALVGASILHLFVEEPLRRWIVSNRQAKKFS